MNNVCCLEIAVDTCMESVLHPFQRKNERLSSHLAGHFASGTRRFLTTMPELKVSSFVEAIVSVLLHVQLNIRVFNF
jgi:hypothetical protein